MLPQKSSPVFQGLRKNNHCASLNHDLRSSEAGWWGAIAKKFCRGGWRLVVNASRYLAATFIFFIALTCWMIAEAREWRLARELGLGYEGTAEDFE